MKNSNCVKLTFTGDIMCCKQEIPASRTKTGEYDFSQKFNDCKTYFSSSDYVVGNLETPIANAHLCNHIINYNSPFAFAEAVKNGGFTMVTTANNHCLDRGISGIDDTIKALDTIGLKHTGINNQNKLPTGIVENFNNMKIGFLSYTYGTNAWNNKNYLKNDEKWKVNLYQEQELYNRKEKSDWLFDRMSDDIKALKKTGAEYVIMCLHAGGQYNFVPLKSTKKITAQLSDMGVDAVITNHEHIIHNAEVVSGKVIVYSLGNFSSLFCVQSAPFLKLSDYSVIFNLYLSKNNNIVKPADITFSMAKTISTGKNKIKTALLYDLISDCENKREKAKLLNDNLKIYNRFVKCKAKEIELKLEYSLAEENLR